GDLVDVAAGRSVPARARIEAMLSSLAEELDDLGEGAFVKDRVHEVLESGNSAERQRRAVEAGAEVRAAVDLVIRETAE
ncbi:MAG: carboxylate--amine ligase, partial [Planctomycetota bacterium]